MRLRWISGVLTLPLLASCVPAQPGTLPGDPLPVERFTEAERPLSLHSALHESRRVVVRDESTLRELWPRLGQREAPTTDPPSVDFGREMVVVVAMGMRSTGGYAILIDGASVHRDTVHVLVRSVSPGPGCMVTQAITHPADAARIPVTGLPVRFVELSEVNPCR